MTAAYDFIVVGAGSAGCAVAGRLATESSASVLLVEAGGSDRRFSVRAPMAYGLQFGTSLDWVPTSRAISGTPRSQQATLLAASRWGVNPPAPSTKNSVSAV
jgi:choline dehydrogenase-like flavoprotein